MLLRVHEQLSINVRTRVISSCAKSQKGERYSMREVTSEWISKAEGDYRSAEVLLYQIEIPEIDTACFHCQQCAEKYVKAFLTEHDIDFPRNHDLVRLLGLCLIVDESFEKIRDYLRKLENY